MGLFNTSPFNSSSFNEQDLVQRSLGTPVPINSTTYVDMLGVLVGLERLIEEPSHAFVLRVHEAMASDRSGTQIGLLNELRIQFAQDFYEAISITSVGEVSIFASIKGVSIESTAGNIVAPLLIVNEDSMWEWRTLSEIVTDINASNIATAQLLIPDGPALQVCRQSNISRVVGEPVIGQAIRLARNQAIPGTELFSNSVPSYNYTANNKEIHFSSDVPVNTTISYQCKSNPFKLITCPISMFSLSDPDIQSSSVNPSTGLPYQIKEVLQTVMKQDSSYWAE